ncbi:hypothetical protein ACFSCX_03445 [Bacillus salitolerans]|uniref:Spore coat protein n=1 Tax=Bacillus salitolerans TaxID=1437434 RepID=A0ABW4LNH7_9BACI
MISYIYPQHHDQLYLALPFLAGLAVSPLLYGGFGPRPFYGPYYRPGPYYPYPYYGYPYVRHLQYRK